MADTVSLYPEQGAKCVLYSAAQRNPIYLGIGAVCIVGAAFCAYRYYKGSQ